MNITELLAKRSESLIRIALNATGLVLLVLGIALVAIGQQKSLTVTGRVVGAGGSPISGASLRLSPLAAPHADFAEKSDNTGRFTITRSGNFGESLFLFISDNFRFAETSIRPIFPPFDGLNRRDHKFRGMPIRPGNNIVDVGDVPVQFWFGTAKIRVVRAGIPLTLKEWEGLWFELVDKNGMVLYGACPAGNEDPDGLNIASSSMTFSLPEGNWRINFRKFSGNSGKIHKAILTSTKTFSINRNSAEPTLELDIVR